MHAVDTNLLIYAHDPRDAKKQDTALGVLESIEDGVLIWQVACEYLNASQKLVPFGYSREQAWEEIERLRNIWSVIYPGWEVLEKARQLLDRYSLSFWDSMILAAAVGGGVERLYTEDFDGYPKVEGVEIVNPFL